MARLSKEESWRQLCSEIGADFVKLGFGRGECKVVARVEQWSITLDTRTFGTSLPQMGARTVSSNTRMRAPYVNNDGFRFRIHRGGFLDELGKLFGMQDIEVGHSDFDRDFIIKANDQSKARSLFANAKILHLVQTQPSIAFQVKEEQDWDGWDAPSLPDGVEQLHFQDAGVIKDLQRLKSLFELFTETLNHLRHIGSASPVSQEERK